MDYLNDTFQTAGFTYDQNSDYGHANFGNGYAGSLDSDGNVILGADNTAIVGELVELRRNGTASVTIWARELTLINSAPSACSVGSKVVCAGDGKIKDAPSTGAGARAGRGIVKKVIGDSDGGKVIVALI